MIKDVLAMMAKMAQKQAMQITDDGESLAVKYLYPEWKSQKVYETGYRVRHNDTLYKCLADHTSQSGWTPEEAPSLWTKVLIPDLETIPEWEQPESTNPYMLGDKVTHNGKIWESSADNNVWEPGVYGWIEVAA